MLSGSRQEEPKRSKRRWTTVPGAQPSLARPRLYLRRGNLLLQGAVYLAPANDKGELLLLH